MPKSYPCLVFKVNLTSKRFGECSCGFIQAEHKPEIRKKIKEDYEKLNNIIKEEDKEEEEIEIDENNQLEEIEEENDEPCSKFKFDYSMPYNTCSCGFTKEEHEVNAKKKEKEKKQNDIKLKKDKNKKNQRQIAIENGVPCSKFEVDLLNKAGLGVCKCGFNSKDHQDFKSSPEVWLKTKEKLTKPKEFI